MGLCVCQCDQLPFAERPLGQAHRPQPEPTAMGNLPSLGVRGLLFQKRDRRSEFFILPNWEELNSKEKAIGIEENVSSPHSSPLKAHHPAALCLTETYFPA